MTNIMDPTKTKNFDKLFLENDECFNHLLENVKFEKRRIIKKWGINILFSIIVPSAWMTLGIFFCLITTQLIWLQFIIFGIFTTISGLYVTIEYEIVKFIFKVIYAFREHDDD